MSGFRGHDFIKKCVFQLEFVRSNEMTIIMRRSEHKIKTNVAPLKDFRSIRLITVKLNFPDTTNLDPYHEVTN